MQAGLGIEGGKGDGSNQIVKSLSAILKLLQFTQRATKRNAPLRKGFQQRKLPEEAGEIPAS
jgi:hypothetical protein